ncbi:MAG: Lrp/AsnC family leucine-responsive transcriptional regulator [Cocleimonas sp.]|jgi:Lrp/AsnC family leucine-responsive transcriptional regulator
MDKFDSQILGLIQKNGRLSNKDIADSIQLSAAPCLRRIKQLENDGIIEGYKAKLNAKKLGFKLLAFVHVTLEKHSPEHFDAFAKEIIHYKEVQECHLMSGGDTDYLIKLLVKDMDEYNRFVMKRLSNIKIIANISSNFVMESIVDVNEIPIDG